jgi:signal transduction histidine kinase
LDKDHIDLIENSEKIEIKILDARIKFADYKEEKLESSLDQIDSLFIKAFQNVEMIKNITFPGSDTAIIYTDDFTKKLDFLNTSIIELEPILKTNATNNSSLNSAMAKFTDSFTEYEYALHLHINETNEEFKQSVFLLLAFILILLSGSLIIVIRLMNSLTQAHLQLVRNTITVEQRERKRVARELHDGLGALLSSIGLYGKILGKELINTPQSLEKALQINQLSKQALMTVSEVVNDLNPSVLNRYNLQESLERLTAKINNLDHINVNLDVNQFKGQPQQSTQVIIYRICSELINNTLKHANANLINIELKGEKVLILEYSDNGIGFNFNAKTTKSSSGMGLQNIIERVESISGSYQIYTEINKGFKMKIQLNLVKTKVNGKNKSNSSR